MVCNQNNVIALTSDTKSSDSLTLIAFKIKYVADFLVELTGTGFTKPTAPINGEEYVVYGQYTPLQFGTIDCLAEIETATTNIRYDIRFIDYVTYLDVNALFFDISKLDKENIALQKTIRNYITMFYIGLNNSLAQYKLNNVPLSYPTLATTSKLLLDSAVSNFLLSELNGFVTGNMRPGVEISALESDGEVVKFFKSMPQNTGVFISSSYLSLIDMIPEVIAAKATKPSYLNPYSIGGKRTDEDKNSLGSLYIHTKNISSNSDEIN